LGKVVVVIASGAVCWTVMVIVLVSVGKAIDVAWIETVNWAGTDAVGAAKVAEVTLFTVNVPESATPAAGVNTQVTPSSSESLGTCAVIVDDWPAVSWVDEARRMTELKSEGTPEQLVQLLLCMISNIAKQNMEGIPAFLNIATP
jgi:predicted secreted protein